MAEKLSPKQKRFLAALLASKTTAEAIRQAHVSERSAYRWLRDSVFQEALNEAESEVLESVMRGLLSLQEGSLRVLGAVLSDPTARQSDKLRAVELALGHVIRLRSVTTLEERLGELEKKVAEVQNELGKPTKTT